MDTGQFSLLGTILWIRVPGLPTKCWWCPPELRDNRDLRFSKPSSPPWGHCFTCIDWNLKFLLPATKEVLLFRFYTFFFFTPFYKLVRSMSDICLLRTTQVVSGEQGGRPRMSKPMEYLPGRTTETPFRLTASKTVRGKAFIRCPSPPTVCKMQII